MADPTLWSRVIHAWPSFALMGAYELSMREFRIDAHGVRTANADDEQTVRTADVGPSTASEPTAQDTVEDPPGPRDDNRPRLHVVEATVNSRSAATGTADLPELVPQIQMEAWRWALANRGEDGSLPTGREIAACFDHKERWGQQGRFDRIPA